MPRKYRLEVGSPGLERSLHRLEDYAQFAGSNVRLNLSEPIMGQAVIRAQLCGLDADGNIVIETEDGQRALALHLIKNARLVFDWNRQAASSGKRNARARHSGRNPQGCGHQRSK